MNASFIRHCCECWRHLIIIIIIMPEHVFNIYTKAPLWLMGAHDFTHLQTWTDPPRRRLTTVVTPHLLGARGKSPETYRYEGLAPGDKGYCCNMWFHFKAAAGWSRNLMYLPTMSRFKNYKSGFYRINSVERRRATADGVWASTPTQMNY